MRFSLPALVLTLAAIPGAGSVARAAEHELAGRVGIEGGIDSNPRRDFGPVFPDAMTTLRGSGDALLRADRLQLIGQYEVGARKFAFVASEDTLVQAAHLDGTLALTRSLGFGFEGRAKDRRGGSRRYSDLVGGGFLEYVPDARLDVRVRLQGHRFLYYEAFDYSFGSPELGFTARYRFDRRHAVIAYGEFGQRSYSGQARPNPALEVPLAPGRRIDTSVIAGAQYSFRGPFALSVGYSYSELSSNSFGEAQQRHRVTASAGFRLPLKFIALAQAALQLSRYPDGVFLSPEIILVEDDENLNSLTLKLTRPLIEQRLDFEFRYGLYQITLSRNDLSYLRHLGTVGLMARF